MPLTSVSLEVEMIHVSVLSTDVLARNVQSEGPSADSTLDSSYLNEVLPIVAVLEGKAEALQKASCVNRVPLLSPSDIPTPITFNSALTFLGLLPM